MWISASAPTFQRHDIAKAAPSLNRRCKATSISRDRAPTPRLLAVALHDAVEDHGAEQDGEAGQDALADVGVLQGLSTATVSRVLNGAANVRPKTREQVLAAIRASGYLPNPAARALSTRRTRTIAAVNPTLAHSIFARFLNAIELKLAAEGYALVIGTTDGDPSAAHRRVEEMVNLGAEGLIPSGAGHLPELYELIKQRGLPTVRTSTFDPAAKLPTIGYDNEALSVMGFDDLDWAAFAVPPLTTIGLPVTEMGEQAAVALVGFLDDGVAIADRRLAAKFVIRASTAPPP